jgi:hypothetical protein
MAAASDSLTGGYLFTTILCVIFLIVFVSVKNYEMKYAFISSSFITFVLAGILWGVGLVGENSVIVCLVLLLVSLAVNIISD